MLLLLSLFRRIGYLTLLVILVEARIVNMIVNAN